MLPYNLLAGGLLTGKHPRVSPPKVGTRFADVGAGALYQQRYWNDSSFDTVEKLGSLAAEAGLTLPALATAWVLSRPAVTSAVLGATKPEQLDVPVGAVSIELGDELTARLDDLTKQFRYGDSEQ